MGTGFGKWSRILVIVGFLALVAGVLDPLEGSIVILLGGALLALGVALGESLHRRIVYASLALLVVGVGALWGLSAVGGFGGTSGLSNWWGLLILPYPIGWVLGIIGAVRQLRGRGGSGRNSPVAGTSAAS